MSEQDTQVPTPEVSPAVIVPQINLVVTSPNDDDLTRVMVDVFNRRIMTLVQHDGQGWIAEAALLYQRGYRIPQPQPVITAPGGMDGN